MRYRMSPFGGAPFVGMDSARLPSAQQRERRSMMNDIVLSVVIAAAICGTFVIAFVIMFIG